MVEMRVYVRKTGIINEIPL